MHVDEFIDQLLHDERVCDIILPRLQVYNQLYYKEIINQTSSSEKITFLYIQCIKSFTFEVLSAFRNLFVLCRKDMF